MLKYLYKTILVSILCGSLLMIDFAYKGAVLGVRINSVQAETLTTGGAGSGDMTVGIGFDGPITSDLMSTLTMVGISIMTSRLVLYGKLTPDIIMAAAGGAAFVAGDMMATSELKKAKEKIETDIKRGKNGDITDEQRMMLIRMIQMYRSSKDAAETKKNMQLAAAAAFAAAAITAYMMAASEVAAMTTCHAALAPVATASNIATSTICAGTFGTGCGVAEADNLKCQTSLMSLTTMLEAYIGGRTPPEPSCAAMPAVNALRGTAAATSASNPATCILANTSGTPGALVTACQAMFGLHLGYESGCLAPPILYATTAAMVVMMGITASTLITAIVAFSTTMSTTIDTAIFIPTRRAVVWGILAALALASSSATSNVISEIDGNIQKLETLVNTINSQANGNKGSNSNLSKNVPNAATRINGSITIPETEVVSDLSVTGASLPCSSSTTTSNSSGCTKNTLDTTSTALSNMPQAVTDSLKDINKISEGFNGTNKVTGGTINAANRLAANAVSLNKLLKKTKEDYQKNLIDSGSKMNLADEEKNINMSLAKSFNDSMKANKFNQASLMAAYGAGGGFNDVNKTATDAMKNLKPGKGGLGDFKMPTIGSGFNSGVIKKPADTLLPEDPANKAAVDAKNEKGEEFDLKNNDINIDKTQNIFNVISNRYQKSGYPRLFKRLNE